MTVIPGDDVVRPFPHVGQTTVPVAQQIAKRDVRDRLSGEERPQERISRREGGIEPAMQSERHAMARISCGRLVDESRETLPPSRRRAYDDDPCNTGALERGDWSDERPGKLGFPRPVARVAVPDGKQDDRARSGFLNPSEHEGVAVRARSREEFKH